jgi:hypothetical protein
VGQCVWWLASIIGLEPGLVNHIDNVQSRLEVTVIPEEVSKVKGTISPEPSDFQEDNRWNEALKKCDEILEES